MHFENEHELEQFLSAVQAGTDDFLKTVDRESLERAADIIQAAEQAGGRVHVSGIGKPAHLAGYVASLLASTGTPAYFLHGTEAVHGSCGQLRPEDVVIFISNSGETGEMRVTVEAILRNGCTVIGVSGNEDSFLAHASAVHLFAGVTREGGPMDRAPRMSVVREMLMLQALSVVLQARKGITPSQYVRWHPGGALGKLREGEAE